MNTKSLLRSVVLCAVVALPASIVFFHLLPSIDVGFLALDLVARLSLVDFWMVLLPWFMAFFITSFISVSMILRCKRTSGSRSSNNNNSDDDDYDDEDDAPRVSGPREVGTVKWFNGKKGFGFITRADGEDIFVHHRSIRVNGRGRRFLNEGQQVEYTVTHKGKGPQAEDVVML
jgi:cold shock CspA family protein